MTQLTKESTPILSDDQIKARINHFGATKLEGKGLSASALEGVRSDFCKELANAGVKDKPRQDRPGYRVCCAWCFKCMRVNSTEIGLHIANDKTCPSNPAAPLFGAKLASSATASARLGKRGLEQLQEAKAERDASAANEQSARRFAKAAFKQAGGEHLPPGASAADLHSYLDRELTDAEVAAIDEELARFCFGEGLPFSVLSSPWLRNALGRLNKSWLAKTRLSEWKLRFSMLDDEAARVEAAIGDRIARAFAIVLLSDGWSGVQKRHVLNIMLAVPTPLFIENIFTNADKVDGEYQAQLFGDVLLRYGDKVKAVCTDNASVMRKTWRLLRDKFPSLWTYGCAAHAFNLHAKDICKLEEFVGLIKDMSTITSFFSRTLQAHGLATLRKHQLATFGKEIALVLPGLTRWNSQVDSAMSIIKNKSALFSTVNDTDWSQTNVNADAVRTLILDVDRKLWLGLDLFVRVMEPIRVSLHVLQSNTSTLGDAYAQFVNVHAFHSELPSSLFTNASTKASLLSILEDRVDFLMHPLHFATYALHPRYARASKISRIVVRKWALALVSEESRPGLEKDLSFFFGTLLSDEAYEAVWRDVQAMADPVKWARNWLDEAPALLALVEVIFSLVASLAAAERNWSAQALIVSNRRNRLTGDKIEKLVAIYWNLRMLAGIFAEREPLASADELTAWRSRLLSLQSFPHPTIEWQPSSNWGGSERGNFGGMHGDEAGMLVDDDEEEQRVDEFDIPASDWPNASAHKILSCPSRVPEGVSKGDHIAVWFGTGFNGWFEGVVDKVDLRRKLPVICSFTDGPAYLSLDADEYGSSGGKQWVLFEPPPAPEAPSCTASAGLTTTDRAGRGRGLCGSSTGGSRIQITS